MTAHGEEDYSIRDTHASSGNCAYSLGKLAFIFKQGLCIILSSKGAKVIQPGCFSERKIPPTQSHSSRDVNFVFVFVFSL